MTTNKRQELEARIANAKAVIRASARELRDMRQPMSGEPTEVMLENRIRAAQNELAAAERELAELDAADDAPVSHYSADGCYICSCHHCALCHDCVKRDCKASDCVTCLQSRHDGHSGFAICPATDCPDFTRIGEATDDR